MDEGLPKGLLGPKHLFLPWLVQSCCRCQPGFRNHWRRHGEVQVEEEEPQVSSATAFQVLLALKAQPTPHPAP